MKRGRLENVCLKKPTDAAKASYNYQQNICVSVLRKSKRFYFENLDVQLVIGKKSFFGKMLHSFLQIKSNLKQESHLFKVTISF